MYLYVVHSIRLPFNHVKDGLATITSSFTFFWHAFVLYYAE